MKRRINWPAAVTAVVLLLGCQGKEDLVTAGKKSVSLGAFEEAIGSFDAALEKDPGYVEAMLGKAEAYRGTGKNDQAETWYKKAMQSAPEDQQVLQTLVDFYMGLGQQAYGASQFDEAIKWFAKVAGAGAAEPARKAAAQRLAECRMRSALERIGPELKKLEQAQKLHVAVSGIGKARGLGAAKKAKQAALEAAHEELRKIALTLSSKAGDASAAAGVPVKSASLIEEGWLQRGRTYQVKVALGFEDLARLVVAIEQGSAPAKK